MVSCTIIVGGCILSWVDNLAYKRARTINLLLDTKSMMIIHKHCVHVLLCIYR